MDKASYPTLPLSETSNAETVITGDLYIAGDLDALTFERRFLYHLTSSILKLEETVLKMFFGILTISYPYHH